MVTWPVIRPRGLLRHIGTTTTTMTTAHSSVMGLKGAPITHQQLEEICLVELMKNTFVYVSPQAHSPAKQSHAMCRQVRSTPHTVAHVAAALL